MTERKFDILMQRFNFMLAVVFVGSLFVLTEADRTVLGAGFPGARVEGVVRSVQTGAPLSGVNVWLDRLAEPDPSPRRLARTDESGRFVFSRVVPGRYRLYAQKAAYLTADYMHQQGGSSGGLLIEEGGLVSDVQLSLRLGGRVNGAVWDEQGQPVTGIIVKLLALSPLGDSVSATKIVSARTDDAGRFQLDGLYPGQYVLRAERRTEDQARAQLEFAYHPAADSFASATAIEIEAGDVVSDVDVTFSPERVSAVIVGTVVDGQTSAPLSGVDVSLVDGANLGLHAKTGADGQYRLEGVSPGRYTISLQAEKVGDGYEWVHETMTVTAGENIIDVEMLPAPLVMATVEYVGSGTAPAAGDYMVSVRVGNSTRGITYNGQEGFEFRGLRSGEAHIGVGFAVLGYKLAGIMWGGQDIAGQTLDLQPGDKLTDVRILITDDQTLGVRLTDRVDIQQ